MFFFLFSPTFREDVYDSFHTVDRCVYSHNCCHFPIPQESNTKLTMKGYDPFLTCNRPANVKVVCNGAYLSSFSPSIEYKQHMLRKIIFQWKVVLIIILSEYGYIFFMSQSPTLVYTEMCRPIYPLITTQKCSGYSILFPSVQLR